MLVISLTKVPHSLEGVIGTYLFKVDTGLWVGDVTRRVQEYLLEVLYAKVSKGRAVLIWKNSKTTQGFEIFEITGEGVKKLREIDGILLRHMGIS
jgi:CRISPR-associated protein Cas2